VAAEGFQCSFVTYGWLLDRVYPDLMANKQAIRLVAFCVDGATRESHDFWRGAGSFDRVIRAVTRCYIQNIPFVFKVGIRRDTMTELERIALLAARLGASAVHYAHFLPTSAEADSQSALTLAEQQHAEQEISALAKILKMPIGIAAGYYDIRSEVPCSPLKTTSCNVDWRGRLTLCCNLAGYRNADAEPDVVADLNRESFADGYARLKILARDQVQRRRQALDEFAARGETPDLYTGSPCLFCLQSFGKIPWRASQLTSERKSERSLPVMASPATASN
jgi:MoaA/NifB/PqqE/SkfB family radical SAM enzyme